MSLEQLVAHAHAGPGARPPLPERAAAPAPAARAADRTRLWPRLVAHQDARGLQVAIERSDRRLYNATHLPGPFGMGLADALRRYLGSAGPVAAGVIVIDGHVAAGRFYSGRSTQGIGVESLRHALALRALHVIDEHAALRHAAGLPEDEDVNWILAPQRPSPAGPVATVLCRMGTESAGATLASLGGGSPEPHAALMRYPFTPTDEDEQAVAAFMRSRSLQPTFGNLLGSAGITRAFEALSGIDEEWPGPLPAVAVVALASRDAAAHRACVVTCGAIAQLCGLLSLDGAQRILLAGPVAGLLQPALGAFPIAARLRAVRGNGTDAAVGLELGVLASPIRYLDGARNALDETLREMFHDSTETVGERVRALYEQLTPSEQRVADLVLSDPAYTTSEPISAIARAAGVSQPQVIRFCRTLGFRGLTDFKLTLVASLARSTGVGTPVHRAPLRR